MKELLFGCSSVLFIFNLFWLIFYREVFIDTLLFRYWNESCYDKRMAIIIYIYEIIMLIGFICYFFN